MGSSLLINPYQSFPAAGGGGGLPASVTHFFAPADMATSGGNVISVTDRVASPNRFDIVGTPSGSDTTGIVYTESSASNNFLRMQHELFTADYSGTPNLAFLYRRNATADTIMAFLTKEGSFVSYMGIAADGSTDTAVHGSDFSSTTKDIYTSTNGSETIVDRGDVWYSAMSNGTSWTVCIFKDVSYAQAVDVLMMRYTDAANSALHFEGDFAGFCAFSDWADAADVSTALLAEVA